MANHDEQIAIVGGGIAGLFCALILARQKKSVHLFETTNRLGGRIRTIRLDKNNRSLDKDTWRQAAKPAENKGPLEFYVEFGPMRIELEKQLLLKALLDHLGIKPRPTGDTSTDTPYLVDFPAYASPSSTHDPKYDVRPEEVGKTPLQLLRLALLRIIVHLKVGEKQLGGFEDAQKDLIDRIKLAAAVNEPVDPIFVDWMQNKLNEQHYWEIQTQGTVDGVPLYAMGFWNLLSDYLSHDAIMYLRDLGTFYHLLAENPNAAEWLVWWLVGFAISEKLQGIHGGMECIIDELVNKLADEGVGLEADAANQIEKRLFTKCWVTSIRKTESKLKLKFADDRLPEEVANLDYDRVILALPKRAVEQIARQSKDVTLPPAADGTETPDPFAVYPDIDGLLDSAFGFPMVKAFAVVKERWWDKHKANLYATRFPTREVHLFMPALPKESQQGLIMAYTDRPASSFWANYVPPGAQIDVHRARTEKVREQLPEDPSLDKEKPLPELTEKRLIKKAIKYFQENDRPEITEDDILWYGIRDWGRAPYSGANHAWRPERRYWAVMRRLAHIAKDYAQAPSIHVCGEAYSDYHGFMEGSLRSALYTLHRILDLNPDKTTFDNQLRWLVPEGNKVADEKHLRVKKEYLDALRDWVKKLDDNTDTYRDNVAQPDTGT